MIKSKRYAIYQKGNAGYTKTDNGGENMDWWIWAVIIIAAIMLAVDWVIVMGANPHRWKGGGKNGK